MFSFSPKVEIINHFDDLINRVDIHFEECLMKFKEDQVLSELDCYRSYDYVQDKKEHIISKRRKIENLNFFCDYLYFNLRFHEFGQSPKEKRVDKWLEHAEKIDIAIRFNEEIDKTDEYDTADVWPESIRVVDYLNQVRMRTIEELKNAQEEALNKVKSNPSQFISYDQLSLGELRANLFDETFYFQVLLKKSEEKEWIFSLFTFVTDFYMSPSDIDFFQKLLNFTDGINEHDIDTYFENNIIFNEKLILIGLLYKLLYYNLTCEKYPSQVILARKADLLRIETIDCEIPIHTANLTRSSIDLSYLKRLKLHLAYEEQHGDIIIEDFFSLEALELVSVSSLDQISIRRMPSLSRLTIELLTPVVNSELHTKLFNNLPNIEYLSIDSEFSNINLDSLENLKGLSLYNQLNDDFNFDFFENICHRLTELKIQLNIDNEKFEKLFYAHQFPSLLKLTLSYIDITKLEKKFFDRFSNIEYLSIFNNRDLKVIENGAISSLKSLKCVQLQGLFSLKALDRSHFSELFKLEYLNLSGNGFIKLDQNVFESLINLRILDLSDNKLRILNRNSFKGLKNLKSLDLRENKLTNFDVRILSSMPLLKKMYLSKNQITGTNKEAILNHAKESKIEIIF